MSWRWSRLSTLAVLLVLYAAPLSSGDKGLWLSVTSMPAPLFGAIPGGMAAEHTIVLPSRGALSLARIGVERGDPALGTGRGRRRRCDGRPDLDLGRPAAGVDHTRGDPPRADRAARPSCLRDQHSLCGC